MRIDSFRVAAAAGVALVVVLGPVSGLPHGSPPIKSTFIPRFPENNGNRCIGDDGGPTCVLVVVDLGEVCRLGLREPPISAFFR
jgi:hypothetical protein